MPGLEDGEADLVIGFCLCQRYWARLAVSSWLRRVIRYESGLIARTSASKAADAEEPGYVLASSSDLDGLTNHLLPTEGLETQRLKP